MKRFIMPMLAIVLAIGFSAFTAPEHLTEEQRFIDYYWFDGSTFVVHGSVDDAKAERPGCDVDLNDPCLQAYSSNDVDLSSGTPQLNPGATIDEEILRP